MNNLRERLKSETLDLHRQTEERSALVPLFRNESWDAQVEEKYLHNLSDQRDLINYLFRHQSAWECTIPSAKSLSTALDELNKHLGDSESFTDKKFEVPSEYAIGVAYVMLGSSMGSRVILQRLGDKIPKEHHPFLEIMADISTNFREFCTELENPTIDADTSIAGAKMAFSYMASPLSMTI